MRARSLPTAVLLSCLAGPLTGQAQPLLLDARKASLPFMPSETVELFAADLDGDALPDVLISSMPQLVPGGRMIPSRLLRQTGHGRFADEPPPVAGFLWGRVPAVADLDGDGDVDLLWESQTAIEVLENDGAGNFSPTAPLPVSSFSTAIAADVTGDGRLDVITAGSQQARLFVNVSAGAASFTEVPGRIPAHGLTWPVLLAEDFDGDGDRDLLLAGAGQELLFANDGTGVFTDVTASSLPLLTGDTASVLAIDHDADGDLDLLLGEATSQNQLLDNQGNGTFVPSATSIPQSARGTRALAQGDIDADGDVDVVLGHDDGAEIWLRESVSFAPAAAGALPPRVARVRALLVEDLDADGDLDLVLGRGEWSQVLSNSPGLDPEILYNDGAGSFAGPEVSLVPHDATLPRLAAGDFDGDGDPDLLESGSQLFVNDGNGVFAARAVANPTSTPGPLAGDLNGDGLDDVVQVAPTSVEIWISSGNAFPVRTGITPSLSPAATIDHGTAADLDGDGDLDVYLSVGNPFGPFGGAEPDILLINDGTGVLTQRATGMGPTLSGPLATGDIDGDGDPDIYAARSIFFNDGGGSFSTGAYVFTRGQVLDVAIADIDGDGWNDLLVTSGLDHTSECDENVIYWNDGSGTFGRSGQLLGGVLLWGTTGCATGVATGDLDGDGTLDVVWSNDRQDNTNTHVQLNQGSRGFRFATPAEFVPDQDDTAAVLLLDVDGDGDPDLLTVNNSSPYIDRMARTKLYLNLRRQLRAPYLMRLGRPWPLELWGAPSVGALLASTGRAAIPTPFGTFRLDPATTVLLGSIAAGQPGTITVQVPALPAIVGATIHWQAIALGAAPALTNAVSDTILVN